MGKIIERSIRSQADNLYLPGGSCFSTSLAVLLEPYVPAEKYEGKQLEDYLFEQINYGPGIEIALALAKEPGMSWVMDYVRGKVVSQIWEVNKRFINEFLQIRGCVWTENGNLQKIKEAIDSDSPVLVHIKNSVGGHIVCIIGYDDNGNFIVNDSWGDATKGYVNHGKDGNAVNRCIYPINWLFQQLMGSPIRMMFLLPEGAY